MTFHFSFLLHNNISLYNLHRYEDYIAIHLIHIENMILFVNIRRRIEKYIIYKIYPPLMTNIFHSCSAQKVYRKSWAAARCISAAVDLMKNPTLRRKHKIKLSLKQFELRSLRKEQFRKNKDWYQLACLNNHNSYCLFLSKIIFDL